MDDRESPSFQSVAIQRFLLPDEEAAVGAKLQEAWSVSRLAAGVSRLDNRGSGRQLCHPLNDTRAFRFP